MKTISLTQPYATLVATGAKRIETRSWPTRYRGPLLIHAAKGVASIAEFVLTCREEPIRSRLVEAGYVGTGKLPRGAIVALTSVVGVSRVEMVRDGISTEEHEFGNYQDGRWAWILGPIEERFDPPIPARGALGLWDFEPKHGPGAGAAHGRRPQIPLFDEESAP